MHQSFLPRQQLSTMTSGLVAKLLVAVGSILLSATIAQAQPMEDAHGFMPRPMEMPPEFAPLPPFLHGIGLSEAQQDKIFLIVYNQAPVLRTLMKAERKNSEALHQMAFVSPFDEAKAKVVIAADLQTISEITMLHLKSEQQIIDLLTPEQRKKIEINHAKMER